MSDLVTIIRAIVRDELASLRLGDIAEVTAVHAHTSSNDGANYECDVKLRDSDVSMTRVPMTTPHVGMVSTPSIGDLVLLSYVHGDANRPIVVGRLYHAEQNPPLHAKGEWRVEAGQATSIAIDDSGAVVVSAGKTQVAIAPTGHVVLSGEKDVSIDVKGDDLDEREREALNRAISIGLQQAAAGELIPAKEVLARLRARRR